MLDIAGRRHEVFDLARMRAEFEGFRISYWAQFGALNILANRWIYRLLDVLGIVAIVGLILNVARMAKARQREGDSQHRQEGRQDTARSVGVLAAGGLGDGGAGVSASLDGANLCITGTIDVHRHSRHFVPAGDRAADALPCSISRLGGWRGDRGITPAGPRLSIRLHPACLCCASDSPGDRLAGEHAACGQDHQRGDALVGIHAAAKDNRESATKTGTCPRCGRRRGRLSPSTGRR